MLDSVLTRLDFLFDDLAFVSVLGAPSFVELVGVFVSSSVSW